MCGAAGVRRSGLARFGAGFKLALWITWLCLGAPASVMATPARILVPFEDTMVLAGEPDANFVTDPTLEVLKSWKFGDARSLFSPDLSLIEADSALSAVFEIVRISSCSRKHCEPSGYPILLSPILDSWNPSEVTWTSQPAIGDAIDKQLASARDPVGVVYQFDVTDLINGLLGDAESPAFGFALTANASACCFRNVYGSLDGERWSRPKLYFTPTPEPGSHVLVAIGFCVLSIGRRLRR